MAFSPSTERCGFPAISHNTQTRLGLCLQKLRKSPQQCQMIFVAHQTRHTQNYRLTPGRRNSARNKMVNVHSVRDTADMPHRNANALKFLI